MQDLKIQYSLLLERIPDVFYLKTSYNQKYLLINVKYDNEVATNFRLPTSVDVFRVTYKTKTEPYQCH